MSGYNLSGIQVVLKHFFNSISCGRFSMKPRSLCGECLHYETSRFACLRKISKFRFFYDRSRPGIANDFNVAVVYLRRGIRALKGVKKLAISLGFVPSFRRSLVPY